MQNIGHGGSEITERIMTSSSDANVQTRGLKQLAVGGRVARETIGLAYGFFCPLEGFMCSDDVEAVCERMRLANGVLWPVPIVLDVTDEEIRAGDIHQGEKVLLTYEGRPLATVDVQEIFTHDRMKMAEAILGTTDPKHPGVAMYSAMGDRLIGGSVQLVAPPRFGQPYDRFFYTPLQLRKAFADRGWDRVVAHQTRNVPHGGHEWLMKGAWFAANGDLGVEQLRTGVLVSCIIGPKRVGDYIDEAIVLGHQALHDGGYFRDDVHLVSIALWDMRYAGPREAVFHAILRENMGCTHHMFGRDHAGVGRFYDPYDAHRVFDAIGEDDLLVRPIRLLEWWYCPVCGEVTYSGLCGHADVRQSFSGSMIRSILQDEVKPTRLVFRPEVYEATMFAAAQYGGGSPFCTEAYLTGRRPVFEMPVDGTS